MTTPTPTSDHRSAGQLPSNWPGIETLTELAREFFTALTGDAAIARMPVDVIAPTGAAEAFAAPLESAIVPDLAALPPPYPPAPDTFASHAPTVPTAVPYYFMAFGATVSRVLPSVAALSEAIPGSADLSRLFGVPADASPASASADTAPYFGFLSQRAPLADASARQAFDVMAVRRDFPILGERVNGKPLVWLDNAATTQKPRVVIDRLARFYTHENSNVHRGAHELAARATDAYEEARRQVAGFLGAGSSDEIVFVRGATEGINLVAKSWGRQHIGRDDEIVVSWLEHHANIVPWQQLCREVGARLRVIPVDDRGQLLLEECQRLLNSRTRIVALSQVSNALGTITPVREVIDMAHRAGALVLVDGAQSVSHMAVDVRALDADFFVFSGHKVFGPTGIGAVYGKRALLETTMPWQGGGNMIADVTFERTLYQGAPTRFEAGTGNIADAVGLGAALEYLQRLGLGNVARYEHALLERATHGLLSIPGLRLIGTAADKASVLSFVLQDCRPEDIGRALNEQGIAVRAGHHCAQPILRRFGLEATVRPSLAMYNTEAEVDQLVDAVRDIARRRNLR